MKFFTTPVQRKIIRFYWKNHRPFSSESLLNEKIVRFPRLSRFCLFRMEGKGQIVPLRVENCEVQYIGSTESKEEWKTIRSEKSFFPFPISENLGLRGLNVYEYEKETNIMLAILKEKKGGDQSQKRKIVSGKRQKYIQDSLLGKPLSFFMVSQKGGQKPSFKACRIRALPH